MKTEQLLEKLMFQLPQKCKDNKYMLSPNKIYCKFINEVQRYWWADFVNSFTLASPIIFLIISSFLLFQITSFSYFYCFLPLFISLLRNFSYLVACSFPNSFTFVHSTLLFAFYFLPFTPLPFSALFITFLYTSISLKSTVCFLPLGVGKQYSLMMQ